MDGARLVLFFPGIGGLALAGFGVLLLISDRRVRGGTQIKHKWPAVQGVVISSSIREHLYFEKDTSILPGSRFEPFVEYVYSVQGRDYGTLASFGPPVKKRAEAEEVIAHFLPGSPVTIHYNPENPGEEVLIPRLPSSGWIARAGIVFLLLGFASLLFTALLMISS